VIAGASSASPQATVRTAVTSCSRGASLSRKPLAPARYILAALATIVGVALCAAGAWRARLLPRWIIPAWIAAWTIGSALPITTGPMPLILAAV
jgi:hypothetical protein